MTGTANTSTLKISASYPGRKLHHITRSPSLDRFPHIKNIPWGETIMSTTTSKPAPEMTYTEAIRHGVQAIIDADLPASEIRRQVMLLIPEEFHATGAREPEGTRAV